MSVPTATIKLDTTWATLQILLDPSRVSKRANQNMAMATQYNARQVVKASKGVIRGRMSPPNAKLTKFIKRSTKPLSDRGDLWRAITHQMKGAWEAEVGVKKGDATANYAILVHEGTKMRVTASMRVMFARLADVSNGGAPVSSLTGRAAELWKRRSGGWKGLKKSTTHITIPPRPFIKEAIDDKDLQRIIGLNWSYAFSAAVAGKPWRRQR